MEGSPKIDLEISVDWLKPSEINYLYFVLLMISYEFLKKFNDFECLMNKPLYIHYLKTIQLYAPYYSHHSLEFVK